MQSQMERYCPAAESGYFDEDGETVNTTSCGSFNLRKELFLLPDNSWNPEGCLLTGRLYTDLVDADNGKNKD